MFKVKADNRGNVMLWVAIFLAAGLFCACGVGSVDSISSSSETAAVCSGYADDCAIEKDMRNERREDTHAQQQDPANNQGQEEGNQSSPNAEAAKKCIEDAQVCLGICLDFLNQCLAVGSNCPEDTKACLTSCNNDQNTCLGQAGF